MKRLVALGDSITYGYPFDPKCSWTEILSNSLPFEVINSGISGDTFADMLRRIENDVIAYKPTHAIVMGGTNDVFVGLSYPSIQQSFLQIAQKLRENSIQMIIGLPLPVEEEPLEQRLQRIRGWLKDFANTNNYHILNFYQDFVDPASNTLKETLLLDGCHPTIQGYKLMGSRVVKDLLEYLV